MANDSKRDDQTQQMIQHITREVVRSPAYEITDSTPLVSSGLIDSLALVNILLRLEDVTETRIPAGKVQPKDMDTVALMLDTAQRLGKPRKR
jgi:acyl carrier protein